MPGQTPKYKIPYAVSSDAINQGAVASQNMANRLEVILSNAAIPVPPGTLDADPTDAPPEG